MPEHELETVFDLSLAEIEMQQSIINVEPEDIF
jgi:hypothetical protein